MLTVFGNFEEASATVCVSVVFNAGPGGSKGLQGQVIYTLCDGTVVGPITFGPSQTHVPTDCVIDNSWQNQMSSSVTVSLNPVNEPCGGSNLDNVYTVERQSDGFSTYAQLNSSYSVNNQVRLSNDGLQCYDIMGTAYVGNPAIYDTITALCSGGGSKGDDVITPF